jgi:hypothetical protein
MNDDSQITTPPAEPAAQAPAPTNGKPEAIEKPREPIPFDPRNATELYRYAGQLAKSTLLPGALLNKPDNVFLVLLKGQDLGLRPMQSIGSIHVIDGKAEVGAHLMLALVIKSPDCEYFLCEKAEGSGDKAEAIYVTRRRGWPAGREQRVTWNVARAKESGLWDKGKDKDARDNNNWKRMPLVMCKRRASAELARDVYPDVVLGMYDHGELSELGLTAEQVAGAIEVTPADAAGAARSVKQRVRARAEANRPEPPAAEPAPAPESPPAEPPPEADAKVDGHADDPALEEPEWAKAPGPTTPAVAVPSELGNDVTPDEAEEILAEERRQAAREQRGLFDGSDD